MSRNRNRPLLWALGTLIVCLVPLGGRLWLEQHGAVERADLGGVGEFIIRDERDTPLNRDQLRRSVTIVLFWPKACMDAQQCADARETVTKVQAWVGKELQQKWAEENNPLNLLIVGDSASTLPRQPGWRVFPESPEPGTIIPAGFDTSKPQILVVDNNLLFALEEDLSGTLNFERLERALSKTTFDQYLGNYLSRRTFMGPKRHQN